MVPEMAAVRRPVPTNEEKEGSCPEPPPERRDTLELEGEDWWRILFETSRVRDGFVRVRECRAERTRAVGSVRKCFAGGECQLCREMGGGRGGIVRAQGSWDLHDIFSWDFWFFDLEYVEGRERNGMLEF